MRSDCIIQARLGSTRFPGKIFSQLNGKPLIQYIIDHLKLSKKIDRIIIATTENKMDDALCTYCELQSIPYYRGPEENVLERFIKAGAHYHCDHLVRVCSDNPFIDINKLDAQIERFFLRKADYCTYVTEEGLPIILKPIGLFAEVVSLETLKRCYQLAVEKNHFEHVTFFIYTNPDFFKIEKMFLIEDINPEYRFTIDYPEDLNFCQLIEKRLRGQINLENLMTFMKENVDLQRINLNFSLSHVKAY